MTNSKFLSVPITRTGYSLYTKQPVPVSNPPPKSIRLNSQLINEFFLSPVEVATLNAYYVLYWTGEYLKHKIEAGNILEHQDTEYIVILPECSKNIFFKAPQIKLSFRKPKAEYNLDPYVLVRFA